MYSITLPRRLTEAYHRQRASSAQLLVDDVRRVEIHG